MMTTKKKEKEGRNTRRKTTKPPEGKVSSSTPDKFKGQSKIICYLEQNSKASGPPCFQNSTTNNTQEGKTAGRILSADFQENLSGEKTTVTVKCNEQQENQLREGRISSE